MTKKITIDFETRSCCDLKKCGAWRYSEDSTTEVIWFAFKIENQKTVLWHNPAILKGYANPPIIKLLEIWIKEGYLFEAHNAEFERAIFKNVAGPKYGWPNIPLRLWRCSAAKAATYNLPRSLGEACKVLGLPAQKDIEGHTLMLRLSKPIKYDNGQPVWDETPEKILREGEYCKQDVESEHGLSGQLKELSSYEQEIWFLDQQINERGVKIDVESVHAIMKMVADQRDVLLAEFQSIVNDTELLKPTQTDKFLSWLAGRGLKLKNMQAETVENALKIKTLSNEVRRTLELRQHLSKSSTAKYQKLINMVCKDGRVRGLYMYAGAGTGRWTGKLVQVQNLPRGTYQDSGLALQLVKNGSYEFLEALFDPPMIAAKKLIRAMFIADDGKELICADYSSIEGRYLAWLADESYVLENYRNNKDAYCVFASQLYPDKTYDEILTGYKNGDVDCDKMRFEGKTGELACGYRGGEKSVKNFAPDMPVKRRRQIVKLWRANRPATKEFWNNLDSASIAAVQHQICTKTGKISFGVRKGFLQMLLPSGRILYYRDPKIILSNIYCYYLGVDEETQEPIYEYSQDAKLKEGERYPDRDFKKETIQFMSTDETGKWIEQTTHGGKLAENATQAISRDKLAAGILAAEKNGLSVVLHVNDEIVCEIEKGLWPLDDFEKLISEPPVWALDCPIKAKGWIGQRYRK